jgi:hypothetical protein
MAVMGASLKNAGIERCFYSKVSGRKSRLARDVAGRIV